MRLLAEIDGNASAIEFKHDGDYMIAEIDGRRYEPHLSVSQSGVFTLISEGHVYECRVDRVENRLNSLDVTVNNRTFTVVLTDPKRLRGTKSSSSHADGAAQIIAPMPGKVVRVLVDVGAEVEAGAGIVVVEAMKMQNELKIPKAGKVTAINVTAGATVNAGDVLAVVE